MKLSILPVVVSSILVTIPIPAQAELLGIDAMAVSVHNGYSIQGYVFAYKDGQVWRGNNQSLLYWSEVDRGIRIKKMIPCNNGANLEILYADDQLWVAGCKRPVNACPFGTDVTREPWVLRRCQGSGGLSTDPAGAPPADSSGGR